MAQFPSRRRAFGDEGCLSHRFEARALSLYFAGAVEQWRRHRGPSMTAVAEWLREHGETIGLAAPDIDRERWPDGFPAPAETRRLAREARHGAEPPPSPLEKRLRWIAATLDLHADEAAILKLAVRAALLPPVHALADALAGHPRSHDEVNLAALAALLALPGPKTEERLLPGRPLLQFGLLEDRNGHDYAPSATVLRLARARWTDPGRLGAELFGAAPAATLSWGDFDHLGDVRDLAAGLIEKALNRREPGVGVMLHGVPGTGKTEFAKTLAARLNARAVFIGETDENDREPSRVERIAQYAFTSKLAAQAGRALLVVDEADDIFTGVDEGNRASRTGSKVFMNRLVERCAAPTLWITNSPERMGQAVLRRMALAIGFREPGRDVRRAMIARLARKRELALGAADLERPAAVQASPALIDAGLRTAALTGGGAAAALRGTASLLAAMGRVPPPPPLAGASAFDPDLSAADRDLAALAERARAAFVRGETALSFCLHGLPGTGKSAYARHLAEKLGLEVVEKRASDLLSMYVGGSEQAIAAAFSEATERRAMLVLDEADSLLRDRAGARQTWEVTQVNEMLTWMARHPFPFACTTNAMGSLDPATLRRFLFKVEFRAMSAAQAREAFVRAFGKGASPALDRLDPLTPGDFAVVARKARVLGEGDAGMLVAMLATEVAAKPGAGRVRMGFCFGEH